MPRKPSHPHRPSTTSRSHSSRSLMSVHVPCHPIQCSPASCQPHRALPKSCTGHVREHVCKHAHMSSPENQNMPPSDAPPLTSPPRSATSCHFLKPPSQGRPTIYQQGHHDRSRGPASRPAHIAFDMQTAPDGLRRLLDLACDVLRSRGRVSPPQPYRSMMRRAETRFPTPTNQSLFFNDHHQLALPFSS